MVKLSRIFSSIQPFSALVLGDFMVDTYTAGRVKRISPEAPVPVLEVQSVESRPGGAGNVVLNLATLGASVHSCGRVGSDLDGEALKARLHSSGVDTSGFVDEQGYRTPVKNRLIGDGQQLLRVDLETISSLPERYEEKVIAFLETQIPQVQVIAVSDYAKGFLTPRILSEAIRLAKQFSIPLIVDPKGADFSKYRGATLIKPNLVEAYNAAKLPLGTPLDLVARELIAQTDVELLLITRSDAGISLFTREGVRSDFPVRSKEVKDVTGAGDTVLSLICLAMASKLDIGAAAQLANIAAGISIERLGCVQVTLSEIAQRLLEYDSESKIFDENHTYALMQVLQGRRYIVVVLENGQSMTANLFCALRDLPRKHDAQLLLYVRESKPGDEFVHLLSSLQEVDFIILQTESLKHLCESIHPHEVYLFEDDEPKKMDQAKELIRSLAVRMTPPPRHVSPS